MNDTETGQDLIKYSNRELVRDVWAVIKPYEWRFFVASLFRFISDLSNLYPSYGVALIVTFFSHYATGDSLRYFWVIMALLLFAFSSKYAFRTLAKFIGYQVAERIALDSQLRMIRHLSLLDIAWHEKENAGNKLKRIQKGSDGLNRIASMWFNNFIEIGVNFVGMIFILTRVDKIRENIRDVAVKEFTDHGHFTFDGMKTEQFPELLDTLTE